MPDLPELKIPRPDEVVSALTSIPPRLSVLVKPLTAPEDFFESTVRSATGFEVPPGPVKLATQFMEAFESGAPGLPLPTPTGGATTPSTPPSPEEKVVARAKVGKIDVEVF
ncbi:MAG: hypothetical protein DRJ38_04470 [Thermoprotei archaeon]|nr:MAG: hypothetical protein DRJ38_04470 [Thermoprotei archaeon]